MTTKTLLLRAFLLFTLLGTVLFSWALWTPSVDSLVKPLTFSGVDFALKSARAGLGTQPIMLIVDLKDSNVYSRYVAEVMKAEGLLSFETIDIGSMSIDSALLHLYPLVVTAGPSSTLYSFRHVLERYVHSGGTILMIAPHRGFASLLGLLDKDTVITDGYVLFDSSSHLVSGLSHVPLQFFGPARLYAQANGQGIAGLAPGKDMAVTYSAAGFSAYGAGRTGFVSYDLGLSVALTRQGRPPRNPSPGSVDRDGDGVFKTTDLYHDSHDYSNRTIPQADEHQKLFVKMVLALLEGKVVVPRVWYFPDAAPAVALLTGDHHGWASQQSMLNIATLMDSVNGHYTFFVYPDQIDTTVVNSLVMRGHAVQPHLYYPSASNRFMRGRLFLARWFSSSAFFRPRLADVESEIDRGESEYARLDIGRGSSTRFHYLVWWGWTETAQLLAQSGYRMDFSISGVNPRAGEHSGIERDWNSPSGYGYVNGSGQPMKFITSEGNLVDLFSQLTQFEDDAVARDCIPIPPNDSITTQRLIDLSITFIDQSINGFHTALVWNFHPEHLVQRWPPDAPPTGQWLESTIRYLRQQNVPMLSADEWLAFVQARRAITIEGVTYEPSRLAGSFSISSPFSVSGVTLHIPIPQGATQRSGVTLSSETSLETLPSRTMVVNGAEYLVISVDLVAHQRVKVAYGFQ